jgi:hypothetical protein
MSAGVTGTGVTALPGRAGSLTFGGSGWYTAFAGASGATGTRGAGFGAQAWTVDGDSCVTTGRATGVPSVPQSEASINTELAQ